MSTTLILGLQSLLTFGQIVNAGIATVTHDQLATLLIGAAVGALQVFVQNVGNKTVPPPPSSKP